MNSLSRVSVFETPVIKLTSDFQNNNYSHIAPTHQQELMKSQNQTPKKITGKKKFSTNKKQQAKQKDVDQTQKLEDFILNNGSIDKSIFESHGLYGNYVNTTTTLNNTNRLSPYNADDLLSMVLSTKKNALMHDPEIIQFISTIR